MANKTCTQRGLVKDKTEFPKTGAKCKACRKLYWIQYGIKHKDEIIARRKIWEEVNSDIIKEKSRIKRQKNKEIIQEYHREYYQQNKERLIKQSNTYYKHNQEKVQMRHSKYYRMKIHSDINFKLAAKLRNRLNDALNGKRKYISAVKDLGCTVDELRIYLESKFQPGMTWDNYGKWHVDHIMPISSFDLSDPEQQKAVCHYTNLQPLWAIDNLKKGDKILEPSHE